jgi:hypothetical protein
MYMEDIHAIRTHLALNEKMRHEFHGALSRLFKGFGLEVDARLLDAATLTTEEELLSRPPPAPTPAPPAGAAQYAAMGGMGGMPWGAGMAPYGWRYAMPPYAMPPYAAPAHAMQAYPYANPYATGWWPRY